MKLFRNFVHAGLAVVLAAGFMSFAGCEVDREDVADARQNAEEERQDVHEAVQERQEDIAEAQADERHETMRPPYGESDEVEEAREAGDENVQEEREEAADAEAEADRMARELAAKEARDAFVTDIRARLEAADTRIEALNDQASELEGEEREAFDARLESINATRDKVETEIDEVESAETLSWETHKADAESAMTELERMINEQ